ncbi:hypothetical protein HY522_12015 [bacterium]|nr:hypothetical protein [bacterium]
MVKSSGRSTGEIKETMDRVVTHPWALPAAGVLAAFGGALIVTQYLAWRLDRANAPVLPDLPGIGIERTQPGPVRLSGAGFVPAPAAVQAPVVSSPQTSSLPVELIGTFVGRHSASSVALLQLTTGTRDVRALRRGHQWAGAPSWAGLELLQVDRSRVMVKNLSNGSKEYIVNDNLNVATIPSLTKSSAAPSEDRGAGSTLLSRATVNRMLNNSAEQIFSWVNVQPHAVGGQIAGFKLNNIKPRGKPFFDLLGFREGDIVKRVNGVKMDSVEKSVGLWESIRGSDRVSFTIDRQGAEKELVLDFKP